MSDGPKSYRRAAAARYLKNKYGFGSEKFLAKLACIGGGPPFWYYSRYPMYDEPDLDAWASSKFSKKVRSTSERSHTRPDISRARRKAPVFSRVRRKAQAESLSPQAV